MASIDLLKELKLNSYFPQKLSFSEAITLRGKSQNGCQEKYDLGLSIARKLLMFDFTAVVSVATEINNRLNDTGNKEAVKPTGKCNVRPLWRALNAEQNQRRLHPMDLLVVVMNCCDDFLRQVLVEKMFFNMISVPILLPCIKNGSCTLLLLALRSLVTDVHEQIPQSSDSLTHTLVDVGNPFVSFLRVGNLHRSKSKMINDLINPNFFNTFFHRECPHGNAKRSVSNGSIEAAWFQSLTATEEEFNCRLFTALNLRGDANDYPKQTQFLCQSSTLVVFMVNSFESFKELYDNVLKVVDLSQTKIIVCLISAESPDEVDEKYFEYMDELNNRGVISAVKYDWCGSTKKMTDVEFTNDLRKAISKFLKPKHQYSKQTPSYAKVIQIGKNLGFIADEDKSYYESGKESADEFVNLLLEQSSDCKPYKLILPLQGEPWEKIGKLERQQRGRPQDDSQNEYFIAEKETEKRHQRQRQCISLNQQNLASLKFSLAFHSLKDQALRFYINFCNIKLHAISGNIIPNLMKEYRNSKQTVRMSKEEDHQAIQNLNHIRLKIANSNIGLEHFLREQGQMYEAVISEEIRMKEELEKARITPDMIHNFPSIVAGLLLMGHPMELMDGNASNVPITWVKAVLNQVAIMTKNAKVFVLSIIGVQSSGKSTLINALFGLQFPVSAGRCTKGIYCHLVPVDKESVGVKYDYVLVVDTEGVRSSEFTGKSTSKDNELATFAIGLADATMVNMKGENWAEMNDILQIVAHSLIRVRKTKTELELMPRCMFVHQNVPAVDAKEKIFLGQEKQLSLLDEAIKVAASKEGFTEITRFDQVIKYDSELHSWYFPDLWNGCPPKARISQDYIAKTNGLRQHLMQVMKDNHSKLTISGFFLRMSDLWNAMLHNDFVLCFRNTQEIMSGTILTDRISHEVDRFKDQNKTKEKETRELIYSLKCLEEFNAKKERITIDLIDAVKTNFTNIGANLITVIGSSDINSALKEKYTLSLNSLKDGEICRIECAIKRDLGIQMKKLENDNDQKVRDLEARLTDLEKSIEEEEKDNLSEAVMTDFKKKWQDLLDENKMLMAERNRMVESEIRATICKSIKESYLKDSMQLNQLIADWSETYKQRPAADMPRLFESDIIENHKRYRPTRWVMEFMYFESYVYKANRSFQNARTKWDLHFQTQKDQEFNASDLEQVMFEVGHLLGIVKKKQKTDEICFVLPSGCKFTPDYINRFMTFACQYTYNQSLENSKRFIALTDPLADIEERRQKSISYLQQMTVEANINNVSEQIFQYAEKSFVEKLGELIKAEVCQEENKILTFKSKRAFLRTILTDLGRRTHNLTEANDEKKRIFDKFMLYVEIANTEVSKDFFLSAIKGLLEEMLIKECDTEPESNFKKMVTIFVGTAVDKAKRALGQAETECKGCAKEYVLIFKDRMNLTNEFDFKINDLNGFTDAVLQEIDSLYADFHCKANSTFGTLLCKDNRAAIYPLFEKIMGCQEKCPFCSAPCSQSLDGHAGDHRANHYPMGVSGTVEIKGVFTNTHQTHDVGQSIPEKLTLDTCQTIVGTRADFRTPATIEKFDKWYHRRFNWNYEAFKNYKEMAEYDKWDIPHSKDHKTSLYWKWFMAQFDKELADHYKVSCPEIPKAWKDITWEEAIGSLDEPDFNIQCEE